MPGEGEPQGLQGVLGEFSSAGEDASDSVTVGDIMERIGARSFGPLLLVPALIAFTPLGGIPGLPTALAPSSS